METAAKIYEEGKKQNKDVVQVNPAWVLEESLESLSSKFPILPRSQGSLTFCTTPLSSKLESKPDDACFDLSDTNVLRYNVLHDPHLKEHFQNPETRRRLFDQGFITEDGYVKCNLVEFNNYRKWIRKLKLEELYKQRRELREEEINQRNAQLMQKKQEREKESLTILRVREQKVKEYAKKRREKRDLERKKYLRLQEIEMRKREKKRKERRNHLDDVEEEREKQQVEREMEKIVQEDKKRKIRLRIVRKRRKEDMRRDAALNERRRLGRCQRDRELKQQWRRRCTIALGNITNKWKDDKQMLELRERSIKRRAKLYQQRQKNNQKSVANFVKTRRATLQQEFLEAEDFLNNLRMRKDIEIANWKRKHERMLSRGSSTAFIQRKGTKGECLNDYMALRRWSAPGQMGFRRRLKSAWDLKSSLIRGLEEESPLLAREKRDLTEEEEQKKETSKTDVQLKVRSFIRNIINNAQNVFEEEEKRFAVKGLVGGIIDSAVAVVENENAYKRNRACVRRYVFSVIESASQTLEKERREAQQAKMKEEEENDKRKVKEQMNRIAAELVSAAMVFAKRKVKDIKEKAAEDDEELSDTAKWIVGTAIERAYIRFKGQVQVQDLSRVSSESLPESVGAYTEEADYDSRLDWVVRNIVSDAVATAVDSMERLYYEECDLMEAATGLMNSAIINAQESLETLHRVTPALEEQINRMAWRLANRALISAENALEKQREESIKETAQGLTSHAILSAQNSFARMEEQMLCDTAEELALQAIMTAQKGLRNIEEEEFFSQELATRAILEAKESLVRADEIERTSRELARQAIELAQVSYHNFPKDRADEAKQIAVAAAERCIKAYKSQENLTPQDDLIASEALKLAIQAINSSEGLLEEVHPHTTCVLTDGKLLSGVMQYVEGIIVRALQELESNKDINVLKPGNIRPDEYNFLVQSDASLHRKSFMKDGALPVAQKEGETAKPASSSTSRRRSSSVHFNATNIFSNRRDSLSRESDHVKVRNRPPTPRFLAERSFTNQLACTSWENLEQKLKHIEKKDRVKVLFSTREDLPTVHDRKRLQLRRFSSDQGIAVKGRPAVVSFQVPHSASDSYFRRALEVQDSDLVKEMLDSSQESETVFLDTKEHRECEYDTLVSMTNTPEPQAIKDSEVDVVQNIRSAEERIPCQITPKTSSYILLPKLEANEKVLLQAKVTELEHSQRGAELSLTRLPAVSPTASLVMVQEVDGPTQPESETTALTSEEHTNLPKISKSRSLVSIDKELVTRDVDQERVRTISEAKSETLTSAKPSETEGVLVSKPSSEVTPVTSEDVEMEASPKPSIGSTKMSSKSPSQVTMTPAEAGKVSPKPSAEDVPKASSDSTTKVKGPSTEAVVAPSREKLSPKASKEKIIPTTSTETAKVSSKTTIESPKASSAIETKKTFSTEAVKISPKPSSDAIKESIESSHPVKEALASATETARLSPISTGESAELSPKVSSVSKEMTQIPSIEAERVSPKSSTEKTATAEKDIAEAELSVPITLTEECKVSEESSFEAKESSSELSKTAGVSSKSSSETTRVSPKASSESAKITPVSLIDAAELPSKTSSEDMKVLLKDPTASAKMVSVPSSQTTQVSTGPSREDVKVSLETSQSAKIKVSPSGEEAKISPKASVREVKLLPEVSSKIKKMTAVSSTEAENVSSKSSSEEILLQKDISESKMVESTASTESRTASAKLSTGTAKLAPASLPDVSSKLLREAATVSPKASSRSAKITPTPSNVTAGLPSKSSSKDMKVSPKDSTASTKMAAIPSSEKSEVSLKPSSEASTVLPKASATTTSSTATAELTSKSSGKEVKILPKDSTASTKMAAVPPTKVLAKTLIEDTKTTKMTPVTSTEAARVSPKSSKEAVKPSPKSSKITCTISTDIAHVAPKLSSESVSKSEKMKQVSSGKASSESLSEQQDKLLLKASIKSHTITPTSSVEDAKMTSKPSSEVQKPLPTTSSGPTRMKPRKSTEAAKLTSRSSSEVAPKPSTEAAKLPKRSASVSTKITSGPSKESVKISTKSSRVKTEPSSSDFEKSKASKAEPKVSPKSSVETTDLSKKVSSLATKMSPKASKGAVKASTKPSSEAARISSQTSQAFTKMTSVTAMESKETVKVCPKPSTDSTKLSPSTSMKMVPSPPSDKEKMSRRPSREASTLPAKVSSESTEITSEVSLKPSGEAAIVTSKTSSVSTKMTSKPSIEETKLSPKRSTDSTKVISKASSTSSKMAPTSSTDMTQMSAKYSTKSIKLSKKTSTGSTKGKSTHSTEVSEKTASPKPSQISGDLSKKKHTGKETAETTKSSTQITQQSPEDSHEHRNLTPKASKEGSKLSLKRSRESSIVSQKASRESHKKKPKHSRTVSKTSSGKIDQLTPRPSSQSTILSPEVSPKDSQVSQMSSMVPEESSECVSRKTSLEITKEDKILTESSSIDSEEGKTSGSAEKIAPRTPSRKASKAKQSSHSLTKLSSKTQSQDPKASVSASVVSTYAIETPLPSTKVDSVESSSSFKSLNKLQTQGSYHKDKGGSQEKLPEISSSGMTDSQSQLPHKDRSHEEGNRRISLSVPDPVLALRGVGRKTSLPGGAFSEHEFERRRLSSLHDISESKEFHEPSTTDASAQESQDQSLEDNQKRVVDALSVDGAENRRLSQMHSIPSITVIEPSSPPNEDNVLFEEDERVRIISELDYSHPVCSDEQISIANNNASGIEATCESYEKRTLASESCTMASTKQSKPSIPVILNDKVSDISKVHRPSTDDDSSNQTGHASPKKQSVTCIGIQFSPTSSKDNIVPNRASEVSLKTRVAKGSVSKTSQEIIGVREPLSDSFELKGIGLGGGRSSSRTLISSRSTEFPRRPLQMSRGHFSSHSLDTPLSRGVIVTPLKPSPPLSPRLIESSARRSRLKMALSQQRAKETQSETSLASSKSDQFSGEASPKKGSEILLRSGSSVSNSLASKESTKTLPERPSTASSMLKREKIKASRTILSSSSSERSDTAACETTEGNVQPLKA